MSFPPTRLTVRSVLSLLPEDRIRLFAATLTSAGQEADTLPTIYLIDLLSRTAGIDCGALLPRLRMDELSTIAMAVNEDPGDSTTTLVARLLKHC